MITTQGLGKRYGRTVGLDGVDLSVERGSVYGLVGPNGAGKTTLLSILAGLRRPTSGTVHVDAAPGEIAVLADQPAFEPWLTGREVVALARRLVRGDASDRHVDDALGTTALADAAGRRVGGYSRGMLQRLGLACCIAGDPSVLLLDEPAAALDPQGRRDVLDLVAGLGRDRTVVLSTHILADVERVCDVVGVLRAGRLVFQGPLDDLLVGRASPAWRVRLAEPCPAALEALQSAPWVVEATQPGPVVLRVVATRAEYAHRSLPGALAAAGALVVALEPDVPDLESVFLELTS